MIGLLLFHFSKILVCTILLDIQYEISYMNCHVRFSKAVIRGPASEWYLDILGKSVQTVIPGSSNNGKVWI